MKGLQSWESRCPHSQGKGDGGRSQASRDGIGFTGCGSSAPSSLQKDSWALKQAPRALTLALGRPPRGSQQPAQVASVGLSHQQWGDDCRDQGPEEAIRFPVQDLQQMTVRKAGLGCETH